MIQMPHISGLWIEQQHARSALPSQVALNVNATQCEQQSQHAVTLSASCSIGCVMSDRIQDRTRGRKWMKIRVRILDRDPICVLCAEHDITSVSVVVDHIKPLEHGGTDDDANLRGLCHDHHDEVTRAQFGYRERVTFGADGMPIEPTHAWSTKR